MKFEWKVTNVLSPETIQTGWWDRKKQSIVLEENTDSEYPWSIVVDFWWDKTNLLWDVRTWDTIVVFMNSKAREYNGRRFNSITWRKIESKNKPIQSDPASSWSEYEDELPF